MYIICIMYINNQKKGGFIVSEMRYAQASHYFDREAGEPCLDSSKGSLSSNGLPNKHLSIHQELSKSLFYLSKCDSFRHVDTVIG